MKIATLSATALVFGMAVGGLATTLLPNTPRQASPSVFESSIVASDDAATGVTCEPALAEFVKTGVVLTEEEQASYKLEMERLDFERRLEDAGSLSNIDKSPPLPDPTEYNDTTVSVEWARAHTQDLYDSLNGWASEETAWGMRNAIGKDSVFVQPREKAMDEVTDIDWSMRKQQELAAIIQRNDRAADFELLSLTCKQFMCEIVGSTHSIDVWRGVYRDILIQASNMVMPTIDESDMIGLFNDDGTQRVYALCRFLSEDNEN